MCVFSVCVSLFIYILYIKIGQSVKLDVYFLFLIKFALPLSYFFFYSSTTG